MKMKPIFVNILIISISFEASIRIYSYIFDDYFSTYVNSNYNYSISGVFENRNGKKCLKYKSNEITTVLWNGLKWNHTTDNSGYRNSNNDFPKILLFGDSMVYGHGINDSSTISGRLVNSNFPAYNYGVTGNSIAQEYYSLLNHKVCSENKLVINFYCVNDVDDLLFWFKQDDIM
ncbi:hypothetical protein, partial [Sediminibacterium sp.]|uniref:hypothetical protein n=1 Tax=Sediminibacterium sp. TaxID=1917865 RepID=UPI003F6A3E31